MLTGTMNTYIHAAIGIHRHSSPWGAVHNNPSDFTTNYKLFFLDKSKSANAQRCINPVRSFKSIGGVRYIEYSIR